MGVEDHLEAIRLGLADLEKQGREYREESGRLLVSVGTGYALAFGALAESLIEAKAVQRDRLEAEGRKLVFTNGSFDILHRGHVTYLEFSRQQGDALIVGLNSDASVKRYKGPSRPLNPQDDRAFVLGALLAVDGVVIFEEDEPRDLIAKVLPHVLVKGSDWAHYVSGRDVV